MRRHWQGNEGGANVALMWQNGGIASVNCIENEAKRGEMSGFGWQDKKQKSS